MHLCICKCKTAAWTSHLGHKDHNDTARTPGPLRSEKMKTKKNADVHVTLISDTLKKANHLNSFNIDNICLYIDIGIYTERKRWRGVG